MSDATEAKTGWALLRAGSHEPAGLGIPTKASGVVCSDGAVRLALGQNGEARLLLPLGPAERIGLLAGAPALDMRVSEFVENLKPKRFLDITCLDRDLEKVFMDVADEIVLRIEAGDRCLDATRSTIDEFRALLLRPAAGQVTQTSIAGLVGELIVLRRLLERSPDAWDGWRGPARNRHDFTRGVNALEVKVSIGKGRTKVTINGLEQLTEPVGGRLFLQHLQLEIAPGAMFSIAGLGSDILARASRPDSVQAMLDALGCRDVRDPQWNAVTFRLEGEALYEVVDGFPRLVPSCFPKGSVPAGVSDVQYAVELAEAAAFGIQPSQGADVEALLLP